MKRRGMTLIELLTSVVLMAMVFLGFGTMLTYGLEGFTRASNDVAVTNQNAQNMRRMTDALRGAMNISINNTGSQITFNYPQKSGTTDPTTGEKELVSPLTSDGVARGYAVNFSTGQMTDVRNGKVLVSNIAATDPQVGSSQYGQTYAPFANSAIGGAKAITINLITQTGLNTYKRNQRFKTTVYLRY